MNNEAMMSILIFPDQATTRCLVETLHRLE